VDTRLVAVVGGVALLLLAACGIEPQDNAQELDSESVPFDLLEPEVAPPRELTEGNSFTIYVLQDESLVAVTRTIRNEPTVQRALQALFDGITQVEAEAGQRTAIPPDSAVRRVTIRGDTAIVDLNDQFYEDVLSGDDTLELAQVVYTATQLEGVTEVRFFREGEPVSSVPRGDFTVARGRVSRNDYPGPGP
jgi:spore germination protein GerM